MSNNLYSMKPMVKPLKGGSVYSNVGIFENVTTTTLTIDSLNVQGMFEDGVLIDVIIKDSAISSTTIGLEGPASASFTTVLTQGDVKFLSMNPLKYVEWDIDSGLFRITSDLKVDGCSELGNIKICNNDIYATNFNGDVNIIPNNLGTIYLKGPVYNDINSGNFYSNVKNGNVTIGGATGINMFSTSGSLNINTLSTQNYTSINGDISLNTDYGIGNKSILTVSPTNGNILVTTGINHDLKSGDTITIINTPSALLNASWTVGNILTTTSFLLNTDSTIGSTFTGGSLSRQNLSNINLNTNSLVKIPNNTLLTFGDRCNSISANTSGFFIKSCSDIHLSSGNTYIPPLSRLNFSSTGNTISYNGSVFEFYGNNGIRLNSPIVQITSTNTRFYDPILTIGDYTPSVNDTKDRGVEFYYSSTSGSTKLGWFGYKTNTGKFTFLTNVTNTNETVTGSIGNFEIGDITTTQLTITGGGLDMKCGNIVNVNTLSGCSSNLTINGSSNVTINAVNRIGLLSQGDILIPNNVPIKIGTSGSYIRETTTSNVIISSANNIQFYSNSKGSIIVPVETAITFDGSSTGSQKIVSNTSGELVIGSNKSIYITTTGGNIIIPNQTQIQFGDQSRNISGTTSGIKILSTGVGGKIDINSNSDINIGTTNGNVLLSTVIGDVNLYPGNGDVRIPNDHRLIFNISGTSNSVINSSGQLSIIGNGNNIMNIGEINTINLLAKKEVVIPINTNLLIGSDGEKTIFGGGLGFNIINTNTNGILTLSAKTTNIIGTSGTLNVNNFVTNVTASNFTLSGSLSQINTDNLRIKDPIITIGDYNSSYSDGLDKGIEYKYFSTVGSLMKTGWFGKKESSGRFTYYSDSINTGEIITGTIGDLEISSVYVRNNLNFTNSGTIDLSCGNIINVNRITGCTGVLNISAGNTNLLTTNFDINASGYVRVKGETPIVFGTSGTTNIVSDSIGNLLLSSSQKIILNADVQINGTTSSVYSTVTNIQDPIFSLGGVVGTSVNDLKDRGIEFKWSDGISSKVGFFGYKNNLGKFVFIRDGINNNEIFSGAYGDVKFGDGDFTNLFINNGKITGISEISGGQITIKSTSGNINITPTVGSNIILPYDTKIGFGNTSASISSNSSGALNINVKDWINISSQTGVKFDENVPINIGDNAWIKKDLSKNIIISNSDGNINLVPKNSTGNVMIPTNTFLGFGSTENSIASIDNKLVLWGYNGISMNSSTVTIAGDLNIIGSVTSTATDFDINKYILPLGTYQLLNVNSITNWTSGNGNVKIGTNSSHYFNVGDIITLRNSNSVPKIDGIYTVNKIVSNTEFTITSITSLSASGSSGTVKSNIMLQQGKDVGIEADYWSTTGNVNVTSGSLGFKRAFFGFKLDTETWNFYKNASINDNVVSGTLGNIVVNGVTTNRISGFGLDGTLSAGSNLITGTNMQIGGGSINNTPIGASVGSTGRFTTLTNTVSASFTNVALQSSLSYSCERYTLSSSGLQTRNPSINIIVSMFSVTGVNWTSSSGTMASLSVPDGTLKTIVCSSMGDGCIHTLFFGDGKLITPNSISNTPQPSKLIFKRRGQSVNLIFDAVLGAWVILGTGAYVA